MPPPTVSVVVPSRPGLGPLLVDLGQRARQLLERVVHRQPAVAHQRGPPLRRRAVTPDEHARLRLLDGLRVEHHRGEVEELAVVLHHVLGPEAATDVDGLVDPAATGVEVEAGGVPLLLEPAGADAELHPSARDHVEGGDRARRDERMAQTDVVDVGAEPHVVRGRGDRGQRHERIERRRVRRDRRVRVARVRAALHLHREHQVLRQPHRLEPRLLGGLRRGRPELGVHPCEHHADLHGARTYGYCHDSSSRAPGGPER